MDEKPRIALLCVGNKLMLDDGLGPAVYDQLKAYDYSEGVELFDVGCISMGMLNQVRDFDCIVTVDALDGTGEAVGTIFKYAPDDMARRDPLARSLHELNLADLFDAASLLGYEAQGICLGMQVENPSPEFPTIGLTDQVHANLGKMVDCVLATLSSLGALIRHRETGIVVEPGFQHRVAG